MADRSSWPQAGGRRGGWRGILPALLLSLALPVLLFPRAMLGSGVVSADDHLTVHAAWAPPVGGRVRHPHLSDPALQLEPLRLRVVQALRRGRLPQWNPDLYGGAPLLADAQSQPLSPVSWLRLLLPEDAAQDAGVAWILAWTALGTGLLARRLGARPWGAAVAAAAAGTGPYTLSWLLHPHAATFAWLPWLLWSLELGADTTLAAPLVALCTLGLVGGGHPGTMGHAMALALGWWLLRRRDLSGAVGLAAGLLLSAPLWAPFQALLASSSDLANRRGLRLPPRQLLDLLWPQALGHPARETWQGPGAWIDGQLHPGLATLGLALAALRRPAARWLWLLWALAVLGAVLGLPGPGDHARLASEAAWLLALAAGLAPQGRGRVVGPLLVGLVLFTGAWARRDDQGVLPAAAHDPPPAPWVLELRQAVGCARPDGPRCGRVLGLRHALQPDLGARVGLRDLHGYDLPLGPDSERLMAALDPALVRPWFPVATPPPAPLLDLAGVRALLSPEALPPGQQRADLEPWAGTTACAVYLRPSAAPRAWLAPAPQVARDPRQALAIASADPQVLSRPPVEGLRRSYPSQAGPITPLLPEEPWPEELRVPIAPRAPALLVLNDAWAPGWTAAIDGRPAPVLRVAGAFRGVEVQPGEQQVIFRYRAPGLDRGLRLAAMGLALLGLGTVGAWALRRRGQPPRPLRVQGPASLP